MALTSFYIDSVVPPTPPPCQNAAAAWRKSDVPLLWEKFGDHLRSSEKLSVQIMRQSHDVYQYFIKERSFTEKQVMNKLQWLKKSA